MLFVAILFHDNPDLNYTQANCTLHFTLIHYYMPLYMTACAYVYMYMCLNQITLVRLHVNAWVLVYALVCTPTCSQLFVNICMCLGTLNTHTYIHTYVGEYIITL